jgi:hypothetical protein
LKIRHQGRRPGGHSAHDYRIGPGPPQAVFHCFSDRLGRQGVGMLYQYIGKDAHIG